MGETTCPQEGEVLHKVFGAKCDRRNRISNRRHTRQVVPASHSPNVSIYISIYLCEPCIYDRKASETQATEMIAFE